MKLTQSLAFLVGAAFIIPFALADFHILQGINPVGETALIACPSNYYNCKCMEDGDRRKQILVNGVAVGVLPNSSFSMEKKFCGMPQLDFYKEGDGHWNFYVSKGNGSLQGTCHSNSGIDTPCDKDVFKEKLLCSSSICGP